MTTLFFQDSLTLDALTAGADYLGEIDAADVIGADLGGHICAARAADYNYQARSLTYELERRPYLFNARDKQRKRADALRWSVLHAIYHQAAQIHQGYGTEATACRELNERLKLLYDYNQACAIQETAELLRERN